MKLIQVLTTTLLMISVLICTPIVKASTVTEALESLAVLRSETEEIELTGVNAEQDRAFLLRKLDAAKIALDQARFCKAVRDLQDFNDRMDKLDKEAQRDGVTVHNRVDNYSPVVDIINNLIQQSGASCGK